LTGIRRGLVAACESAAITEDSPRHFRRLIGPHSPRIRRVFVDGGCGLVAFAVLVPFIGWQLATLGGWDVAAILFLAITWRLILRADPATTQRVAMVEDETKRTAALVVLLACMTSLLAVAFTLATADRESGWHRSVSIGGALLTVVLSWAVLNTLFTLRYADAHYHFRGGQGVVFGDDDSDDGPPDYRDFAYLAFTIGMCYQVSDQSVRSPRMRRTVLVHSLVSYVFGVVIIASTINVIGGLVN
jgi:uncharacterized membrane protein